MNLYVIIYKNEHIICISDKMDNIQEFFKAYTFRTELYSIKILNDVQSKIVTSRYTDLFITKCFECYTTNRDINIMNNINKYERKDFYGNLDLKGYDDIVYSSLNTHHKEFYSINKVFYDTICESMKIIFNRYYGEIDCVIACRTVYTPYKTSIL